MAAAIHLQSLSEGPHGDSGSDQVILQLTVMRTIQEDVMEHIKQFESTTGFWCTLSRYFLVILVALFPYENCATGTISSKDRRLLHLRRLWHTQLESGEVLGNAMPDGNLSIQHLQDSVKDELEGLCSIVAPILG